MIHRTCKEVEDVSEVAKGIHQKSDFKAFLASVVQTQYSLRNKIEQRVNNKKLLQQTRLKIITSFKTIKEALIRLIDELERESTTEMDRLLIIIEKKLESDKNICSDFDNCIQKFLDNIHSLGKQNEEFAFQCFNKYKKKLANTETVLASIDDDEYQLHFTPDTKINKFLYDVKTLGKFVIKPKYPPEYIYTVESKQSFNIRTDEDKEKCAVTGMCLLPGGQVAIVDNNNKKIKLLCASRYSVIAALARPPCPEDICHINGTQLVVTVCSWSNRKLIRSELQYICAAQGKLVHTKTVKLDHKCGAIAFHNGRLYVSSWTAMYEYCLSGNKQRKLYGDDSSEEIKLGRLVFNDRVNRFYVTNFHQDLLVILGREGNQLSKITDSDFARPAGVCVTDNGAIFLCGQNSRTIVQIDSEGRKKMVVVATQPVKNFDPLSLCYTGKTKTLLVGQAMSDVLLALYLK